MSQILDDRVTAPSYPSADIAARDDDCLQLLDSRRRDDALAIWELLEADDPATPLMVSRIWTACWLDHYGDLVPHRFAVWRTGGEPRGIALLTQGTDFRVGPWYEQTWHVGTAGETERDSVCVEYNSLLCPPELRDQFWHALFDVLDTDTRWDATYLDGFDQTSLPETLLTDAQWEVETKLARWADLDAIRATGQELIQSLGDSTRKNIRQSMRKLDDVRLEWAESVEHALDIFDDLIILHQARWNRVGQPGCYASERFTAFHRDLIRQLAPRQMALVRVTSRNRVIGCSQLMIDRGRALVYQGGRAEDEQGSPGLITDFLVMQECLFRGYSAYDFMAGDSMHKQRLTNRTTPLCWAVRRRPRWKYHLTSLLRNGRARLRSLWQRQRPAGGSDHDQR